MRRGLVFRLAFSWAIALALGGCDKKTRECNAVVEVVNGVEASAKARAPDDAKADAAALRGIADAEEGAARELAKARTTAPELGDLGAKLQTAFKANAVASRDLATLLDRIPDAAAQKAIEEKSTAAREAIDAAEVRIAARCSDDAQPCAAFAPALKKHPDPDTIDGTDGAKTKAWADAVAAWSADIAKVEVKDAELGKELEKLRKGYTDLAAVIVDVSQITADAPKRKTAQEAQAKSAKEIGSLIEALNKFCQET
jgi:hypothetical protein